jgi:hypothetical protein
MLLKLFLLITCASAMGVAVAFVCENEGHYRYARAWGLAATLVFLSFGVVGSCREGPTLLEEIRNTRR